GAAVDDGLAGLHAHVDREEAAERGDRPLPNGDAGAHHDEPRDEERPAGARDRRAGRSSREEHGSAEAADGGQLHDEQAPPVELRGVRVAAAPQPDPDLREDERADDEVEGEPCPRLVERQRGQASREGAAAYSSSVTCSPQLTVFPPSSAWWIATWTMNR